MKFDLLKTTGKKIYRIKKIREVQMIDEKAKKIEDFVLQIESEKNDSDKIIINFEILKLLHTDNYIIEQKYYNLMRNRKVLFNLEGKYIDTLNKNKILTEWDEFRELMSKDIENPNLKTEKEFELMRGFLVEEKYIVNSYDIFSIFFPKIYNKEFINEIYYNDSMEYFFGAVNIPVKVKVNVKNENENFRISTTHDIDDIYFRKYEIKEVLEYNKINVDYNKNIIMSFFSYDLLFDKERHLLKSGEIELGGEIKDIYKNYTKFQIEEMV